MNRRNFLYTAAASGAALAFGGMLRRTEIFAANPNSATLRAVGYGALAPTKPVNSDKIYLALPAGFQYSVFGEVGKEMSDGRKTPRFHDGMAAFKTGGEIRLVRNHEINDKKPMENVVIGATNHYDSAAGGGTSTLVVNPKNRELVRDFVSLSGTLNNCAGGATPWGSWISCEETTLGQTKFTDKKGREVGGFAKPHGYCFEVPASANNNLQPAPLAAMGRFCHEAVSVDASTGIVYLTEDALNNSVSGFYRFLPNRNKRLSEGGKLQMLAIKNQPEIDLRKNRKTGDVFTANWVTIDDPNPEAADTDELAVFKQGIAKGAATFIKLEGCFAHKKRVYFVSSSGGDAGGGQVWLYQAENKDEGRLTLVYESIDRNILDMPDNIFLHPKSNLLFMCEDSDYVGMGGTLDNFVRILTPNGKIADFARNITDKQTGSEFAGATFDKDGKTMFVNLQTVGVTLAIWGEWENFVN